MGKKKKRLGEHGGRVSAGLDLMQVDTMHRQKPTIENATSAGTE